LQRLVPCWPIGGRHVFRCPLLLLVGSTSQEPPYALSCLGTGCGFVVTLRVVFLPVSLLPCLLCCPVACRLAGLPFFVLCTCCSVLQPVAGLFLFICALVSCSYACLLPSASLMTTCLSYHLLSCRCLLLVACMVLGLPRLVSYFFFACFLFLPGL
jgi:hypothetical protein